MLANFIAVANNQITALAGKHFVERIGSEHGSRGDFVVVAERGPTLYVHIWLEQAMRADDDIRFDHAKISDASAGADHGVGMNASSGSDLSGRVDGHTRLSGEITMLTMRDVSSHG